MACLLFAARHKNRICAFEMEMTVLQIDIKAAILIMYHTMMFTVMEFVPVAVCVDGNEDERILENRYLIEIEDIIEKKM